MLIKTTNDKRKKYGFTIVELLVVIVVIGILAAITIVSYTGITSRAKTSSAQSNAQSVQSVAEAVNAEKGAYPTTIAEFSPANIITKLPIGLTLLLNGDDPTKINGEKSIKYEFCGSVAVPTAAQATGARISYFDFSANNGAGAVSSTVILLGTGTATDTAHVAPCHTYQHLDS